MIRDEHNVVPVVLAILLHVAIFAAMVITIEFSRPQHPATPLAIEATLVTDADLAALPVDEPEPQPVEPEPEPEPVEPEPEPEPDLDEQRRIAAEEAKRQQELEAEQQRIREEQVAEQRRLEQEAQERLQREAAEQERQRIEVEERQKREEAEQERQRQEAERKRLEEVERQRQENERKREAAEDALREQQLQRDLDAELARQEAMESGEMGRYQFAIQRKIEQNWIRPASAQAGLECVINVRQVPGGEVISAAIERCNGDAAVQRSIEAAVFKASPLPEPENPALFERNLRITFKPEQ